MEFFDTITSFPIFKTLERENDLGKLSKSILLISKDEILCEEFAKILATMIIDGKIAKNSENLQKISLFAHPDVKFYPKGEKILVADSEDIVMENFIKPVLADKKVFIIRNIDEAQDSAQNKLLKVLEEPANNVYFILTCSTVSTVLPTIRSRCSKFELPKLQDEDVGKFLSRLDERDKLCVLALSGGLIGKASALAKIHSFSQICSCALGAILTLSSSKQVLEKSKEILSTMKDLNLFYDILSVGVSDLIKIKGGQEDLVKFTPFLSQLRSAAESVTLRALCEMARLIDEACKEATYNVNSSLIVENLLLNILEVKYLCK